MNTQTNAPFETIGQLATMAYEYKHKKPNKKEAMGIVTALALGEASEKETKKHLVLLYKFFMQSPPAKPKTKEQWVGKAVPKRDARYYLNFYHVLDGWLSGTDGHRLHFVHTELSDGFYDQNLNPVEVDGSFPDVTRVIPKDEACKEAYLLEFTQSQTKFENTEVTILTLENEITIGVNTKYLLEACSRFENPRVYYRTKNDSLLLKFNNHKEFAVIMPIRM